MYNQYPLLYLKKMDIKYIVLVELEDEDLAALKELARETEA